jgi:hypothetical protein
MSMNSHGGMIRAEETEELGVSPVPVPLCRPQISRGLTGAQTSASAVRGEGDYPSSHGTDTISLKTEVK